MNIRTTKPSNNKYFIRQVSGGYNGAIKGYPTDKNADVLANCVGYANGRFNEIGGYGKCKYQLVCNAENFIERAKALGLTISSTPTLGGIMVWRKGATLSGKDGAGHVAIVEKIINKSTIYTSESGYGGTAFFNATRSNANGRWGMGAGYTFRGCIVNPAVEQSSSDKILEDGLFYWSSVRKMQRWLKMKTVDGVISGQLPALKKNLPAIAPACQFVAGGKGSATVVALQKKIGSPADGLMGKATVTALQKYLNKMLGISLAVDGIFGSGTAKAFQKYLNNVC